MKKLVLALFCFTVLFCNLLVAQKLSPQSIIEEKIEQNIDFRSIDLFSEATDRNITVPQDIQNYVTYDLDDKNISTLLSTDFPSLKLNLKDPSSGNMELLLYEVSLGQFNVVDASTNNPVKYQSGKFYRGVVKGKENSIVAINIFNNEVSGIISLADKNTNYVLGKLDNQKSHIIYEDKDIKDHHQFECAVEDQVSYNREDLEYENSNRALTDCVGLYFEVDYDIYQNKGGMTQTADYITALYNEIATLYANENINTNLSEIVIWSSTSPYNSTSSSGMLNQFTAYRQGFNGDIAQLLSYKASGGIAYVNTLCNGNPDYRMSFASIGSSFNTVPTYSWTVMVCTHEFGHLLGSNHTHACAWNGNNTAIDGCYTTEGSCSQPPIPSNGGTIMSYCHLTSAGINFTQGFGTQPGNVIRNKVTNASCLQACPDDGGNNGGGDGGGNSCVDNQGTLSITLDNYPGETTWNIKNANNQVLYQGGPYNSSGATVNVDLCLLDGCFTFNIYDSWGDGICCGYGNGSYQIVINGQTEASGGQFGSSNTDTFCLSGGSGPTCNDGFQNGNETGIDCGGPDCDACPSCDDGILNGDETGIDCGGNDCPACFSCNDGIQNGNETGIDCGGSDCSPCNNPPSGDTELLGSYFESGWDNWEDGGSDCARYNGYYSYEGNYSIRLRDNSGEASAMTSPSYDATPFSQLLLTFYFYAYSMENGEDFFVEMYNGSSWVSLLDLISGVNFSNNTFYQVNLTIDESLVSFYNDAKLRIRCDASANSDYVYIDGVTLIGTNGNNLIESSLTILPLDKQITVNNDVIRAYPNPASDKLIVQFASDMDEEEIEAYNADLFIYNSVGKLVHSQNLKSRDNLHIDVSQFNQGLYYINIIDSELESTTMKIIVVR